MQSETPLRDIARALVAPGKGILAADESESTMEKRFAPIGVERTPENDRRYRNLLFTAPGIEAHLGGVILHDETIRQRSDTGVPFADLLTTRGILPGIKVDLGLEPLVNFPDEEVSRGLDTLDERLREYAAMGARFTKWRAVVRIGTELPTDTALRANAEVLARYAAAVQAAGLVPMVEPEVLYDGTHTLERSAEVLHRTLNTLFELLEAHRVSLPGLILKTSMALPGKDAGLPLDAHAVAHATMSVLHEMVPAAVAGVVFLSGGQTPLQATVHLQAMAHLAPHPWPLTFSYSRAIEEPVLAAWGGLDAEVPAAQAVLLRRLMLNAAAAEGTYTESGEVA